MTIISKVRILYKTNGRKPSETIIDVQAAAEARQAKAKATIENHLTLLLSEQHPVPAADTGMLEILKQMAES